MGTLWRLSGTIQADNNNVAAAGAKAYIFEGGTTTPWDVFQDAAETTPHAHPIVADGNGRWPLAFIKYRASYDEQIKTSAGAQITYYQNIPNPDPVEASEDSVDENALLQTGECFWKPADATRAGCVRLNGRTIGSASSAATERANADTEDLYLQYWNTFSDTLAPVTSGRGASAAADFAANKPIRLLDLRGGVPVGLDTMGNSAAGRFVNVPYTAGDPNTPGSVGGLNQHILTEAQLPSHTHSISITSGTESADHTHSISITSGTESADHTHSGTTGDDSPDHTHNTTVENSGVQSGAGVNALKSGGGLAITSSGASVRHQHAFTTGGKSATHTHLVSGTSGNKSATHTHLVSGTSGTGSGSGASHNNLPHSIVGTWFQRL